MLSARYKSTSRNDATRDEGSGEGTADGSLLSIALRRLRKADIVSAYNKAPHEDCEGEDVIVDLRTVRRYVDAGDEVVVRAGALRNHAALVAVESDAKLTLLFNGLLVRAYSITPLRALTYILLQDGLAAIMGRDS